MYIKKSSRKRYKKKVIGGIIFALVLFGITCFTLIHHLEKMRVLENTQKFDKQVQQVRDAETNVYAAFDSKDIDTLSKSVQKFDMAVQTFEQNAIIPGTAAGQTKQFQEYLEQFKKDLKLNKQRINLIKSALEGRDVSNKVSYKSDKLYSHRGASGEKVEHTFPAYDLAIEQGSKNIEIDIVISKDGTLWVSHDVSAKRMTSVDKKYADMTDEEISKLRIMKSKTNEDLPILKVEDVLNRYGNKINYVIETKPWQNQDVKLINMIKERSLQKNVVYQTVQDNITALEQVKKELPETQTLLLLKKQEHLNNAIKLKNVDIIGAELSLLNQENVDLVHANGKQYSAWTLNTEEEIRKGLTLGVDSYFTDFTDRGISVEKRIALQEWQLDNFLFSNDF